MIRGKKYPLVHVVAYRKAVGSELTLLATPDPLDMTEFAKGAHLITWLLDTKGYRFSTDPKKPAIEFTSPGWEESFSNVKVDRTGKRATVRNKNSDGLAFAYNINVVESSTGLTAFLDPVIQNQNN